MIIICVGDSFTAGNELYEEKFLSGFIDTVDDDEAYRVMKTWQNKVNSDLTQYNIIYSDELKKLHDQHLPVNQSFVDRMTTLRKKMNIISPAEIHLAQRELTYTSKISEIIGCNVYNLGVHGASGLGIIVDALPKIKIIREQNPTEKIICTFQHTSSNRIFIEGAGKNINVMLSIIKREDRLDDLDKYEVKNIYLKYKPEFSMIMEYLMAPLTLQNFCLNIGIDFLHFQMTGFEYSDMFELFYKDTNFLKGTMKGKLMNYYGNTDFILPLNHFNHESHMVVGEWLVEEMQKRDMI